MCASFTRRVTTWVLGTCWLGLLALALFALMRIDTTAGASGDVPAAWPADSGLTRATDRQTMVVALHPHCPCSAATFATLVELLDANDTSPLVYLLFRDDASKGDNWVDSALWRRAATLPSVNMRDEGGVLATRFGALTSGAIVVYGADGQRGYAGGLTPARGVEGAASDREALASAVFASTPVGAPPAPVYGCPLRDRSST